MKEIKVKITRQHGYPYNILGIDVKPLEKLTTVLDMDKSYKLVEDEPVIPPLFMKPVEVLNITSKGLVVAVRYPEELRQQFKDILPVMDVESMKPMCKDIMENNCGTALKELLFGDIKPLQPTRFKVATLKGTLKQPVARVMFNGNATILEIGDFKTVVKCHEGDKFSYVTGLGLALSRYYKKQPSTKKDIKHLSFNMEYDGLAQYCFEKYFNFDKKRIWNFLKNCNKNVWVDLNV